MNLQERLTWLQGRQRGVGSSDSPILALEPEKVFKKSAVDVYISKKHTITMEDIEGEVDNEHFRRGNTYEPLAIAMYEQESGIKCHAPVTDEERVGPYQLDDPDNPMFSNLDGFCEDGWVLEAKAPMQRVCDGFRTKGIREYYMVQGQHHAHHANVCPLPFLGKDAEKWLGKIKGTRLIIYEPEKVQLQIVEIPIDHDIIKMIIQNANKLWDDHIIPGVPPAPTLYDQPVTKKASKGKYKQLEGDTWQLAVDAYKLAKERELVAKVKMAAAKLAISQVMETAGHEAIQVGPNKFLWREVAGRRGFSKTLLQADFPDLDLSKYEVQGQPHVQFNHYGPKEKRDTGDESLDSQVVTIQVELEEFAGRDMDIEEGVEAFDEIRARADLYAAMLEMELGAIRNGIEKAAEAVTRKLGLGAQ